MTVTLALRQYEILCIFGKNTESQGNYLDPPVTVLAQSSVYDQCIITALVPAVSREMRAPPAGIQEEHKHSMPSPDLVRNR